MVPGNRAFLVARAYNGATLHFEHLDAVTYVSQGVMWSVGSHDMCGGGCYDASPIAVRCFGTNCASYPPLGAGLLTKLRGVAGAADNDVWAVGSVSGTNQSLIEHWDGSSWSIVPSPNIGELTAVTAVANDNVWTVGPGGILHYDGSSWTQANAPAGAYGIASREPDNVWAVGAGTLHYPDLPALQ